MIGVFIVGVATGFIATVTCCYIIGYKRNRKALPPHDPDRD